MSNLSELRKKARLSQSQLAERSNVSVRIIQKYEQGDRDINKAQVGTIYRLSQALDASMEDIININELK